MRIVVLTWEYPPRVVGELATEVEALSKGLAKRGVEVHVITYHDWMVGDQELDGVFVHRATNPVKTSTHVLTWAMTMNGEFVRMAADLYYSPRGIDVVDAHEWLCVPAAINLKRGLGVPFVFSVHSLEDHRSGGAQYLINEAIKSVERLGTKEAQKMVVKSNWMAKEVGRVYQVPKNKITVVTDGPTQAEVVAKIYEGMASFQRSPPRAFS